MKILILNWRDIRNPFGGGAEIYIYEIAKRWVQKGHEVTFFCSSFPGALAEEDIDGIKIIRRGNRLTVVWKAYRYYRKRGHAYYDCVIDSINTIPFFTPFYVRGKRITLFFQLAREVWFYETPFLIAFVGYMSELLYLRFYRKEHCVTISESSKKDLMRLGVKREIPVFSPGVFAAAQDSLPTKEISPTFIYLGRLKKSKRIHHILKALSLVQRKEPNAKLWIVGTGDEAYESFLKKYIRKKEIQGVTFWGYLDEEKKVELMKRAHLILVTSVREGWGMIIMEAAAQGTPAVVYNVPGLVDSVQHNVTGRVTSQNNPSALAEEILSLLESQKDWTMLANQAMNLSKTHQWASISDAFLSKLLR